MAALIIPGLLQNLIYPAALTASGLIGNAYILGGQIEEVKDDLGGQIKEVKDNLGGQIQEMRGDIKGLIRRQAELEAHDMAQVQKLVMDCGNKKMRGQ